MISRLAHVCIGAIDLEKSRHFYCDVLGMERGFEFHKNGELYGFYVKTGGNTYIEIFTEEHKPDYDHPIMQHLCLEVADLDSVITTVRSRGWEITDKKMGGDKSWQAWMKDPSGVPVEVMQYTAESSQFTGNPCPVDW